MFKVGDTVEWTSQAQGSTTKKRGVVAEVVAKEQRPDRIKFASLYKHSGCGWGRDHESYVVMVGNKPYWPRANALRNTAACPHCGGTGIAP
jgi:hypothetical protein